MTNAIHKSGPAFPLQSIGPDFAPGYSGMSLRDWFAGQALVGLLAHASGEDPHKAPELACKLADAMLKARETDQ